ncbi:hypothetical protein LOK49_LG12G01475 [Camellia lanceoleosa]|uniref:Uncharacterized protein n=1 Tax=Camellia lanceoleosa TaxID=1840588 RepID=A0ACC0FUI4_9ERIC|nr:hypothetical protein LOK49_LG12G01475 [Camellia lanceoleosa]
MDVESRGGTVVIIERNRFKSYTMKMDLGGVSWAIQALRKVWGQRSDKPFFFKYSSSSAVFWIQKVCNKNGVFAEISKWEAGVNRNNIIIPAGVDGQGWEAMAEMLERVIYGDSRATTDEKGIRTTDKGGLYRSNHDVFSTYRRNTNGSRFISQKTGANRGASYAEVLKSKSISCGGNNFSLEMSKVVVCTRIDFFDGLAQIEKELNRSFKASIVLRPFQLNKALFLAKSSEEADYYGAQGVCFFNKSTAVRLERWSEEMISKDTVIASNGSWISVCDLPFNLWNKRVFEWIGSKCGGLLEVDRRTRNFENLFEARLKVRGCGNGFLPAIVHVQLEEISVIVRLEALSKPIGRREVHRQGRWSGDFSAGEEEGEESQETGSTRGKREMRRQMGDLCEGGVGNGGSARVERGSQAGDPNGLSFKSNGLGHDVGSTHDVLVSSKSGGLDLLQAHVSQTFKDLDPVLNGCPTAVIHVDRGPNNIAPRASLSDPIEVLGLGSDRVNGYKGEEGLRRCTAMMEISRFSTCDVLAPAVRHVQVLSSSHSELNLEEARLGLADVVDRSSGDFQNLNGLAKEGIGDLMEVIKASEKQIHEVDEGHFEIHEVLQNLEDYGSSASSESKSDVDISEDEQDENVWDLNRFFNEDCTTGGEGIGKVSEAQYQVNPPFAQGLSVSSLHGGLQAIPNSSFVGDRGRDGLSVFHQSNSFGPIHEVSLANNIVQGVTVEIPTTTVNESILVSESLHANISQGQVNDNQCGIFENHLDKGGQVFSEGKEETESWLHELSKYETCPIEER